MTGAASIDVWVCARPGAPHLDVVLEGISASGADPRVATAPAGHGLAAARNEALARCDGDVLALIEDDVEVSPGWLDALRAAWSGPDVERLACVGGPLRAAFAGERPAWLGDDLLAVLGVDGGPPRPDGVPAARVPVDVRQRTFHGGNVSFRAAALRGVGGFWPARGHPGLRDWFGEEHRAQHELAAAGWQAAWAHDAGAARQIHADELGALAVVLSRAQYGARAAAVGARRDAAAATRAMATAAAGVPAALVRRDARKLVERAARAAENAGLLAGLVLPPPSLQPTTTRTAFAFSVPPPAPGPTQTALSRASRSARRLRGGSPLVLVYHRVATRRHDPLAMMVSPQHFAEHMAVLAARRTPVPLQAIVTGNAPASAVAVTLDDGYADALEDALPALEATGVPATVFVSTGHVEAQRAFWWDAVARLLRAAPADAPALQLVVDHETRVWPAHGAAEREMAFRCVGAWLHGKPPETIDAAVETIATWAGVSDPLPATPDDRPLTRDELRRLAASPLITIGAHGRRHPCLAALPPERQAADLVACRDDLAGWLGSPPAGLAYPFGVPGVDVDATTREAARATGYDYAVVNTGAATPRTTDRLAYPRTAAGDVGADAFEAWLVQAS